VTGVPLRPDELAVAAEAFQRTGTFTGAARAVGRPESTVRRALRRHSTPERAELYADTLDAAQHAALRMVNAARTRVSAALDDADDVRDLAMLAHAAHEGLRAVTTARLAHARLAPPPAPAQAERDLATMTDDELRTRATELRRELAEASARGVAMLTFDELSRRVHLAVVAMLDRAARGDALAQACFAELLEDADRDEYAPGGIYLPMQRE